MHDGGFRTEVVRQYECLALCHEHHTMGKIWCVPLHYASLICNRANLDHKRLQHKVNS